jgi:predicted amidohydrolase YtcJ
MPTILALLATAMLGYGADLLVENAVIYTLYPQRPVAATMLVRDGKVVALGPEARQQALPEAHRLDANGHAIVPGFIDSHGHMAGLGDMLESVDLRDAGSIAEVAKRVRERAAETPNGEWIHGRAWDQTNWGGEFPTATAIDGAAGDHPVYLVRVDGHAAWVNHRALEMAGITKQTQDPPGGRIIRDADGNPTGVLVDRAQGLVSNRIPKPTFDQVRTRLSKAATECARLGLTGVGDAGVGKAELEAYRQLIAAHQMPVRIYAMIGGDGELWRDYLIRGPEIGDRLTVRSIKLYADGAMGSRGAAFFESYADDPGNRGLLMTNTETLTRISREAVSHGFQVCTHAIGDRANAVVLDAYAAALGGPNDKRFRIEHAQVVRLTDFPRFAKYNVIASIQSTHATSDMRWAEARLGKDRLAGAWATERFLKTGVRICNGSDFPVESANPLWGFYAAVTRQDHQGKPPGGFLPDQKLSREEALKSWTLDGAYAAFEEKQKGSLEPGKVADFVMLSEDIMRVPDDRLLGTRVLMTVVGGEVVWAAPE